MIHIVYHRKYHRVTAQGHAQSGEPGHDLVCASATILLYTLADRVLNMAESNQVRAPKVKMDLGDAEISCNPNQRLTSTVTLIFDSICAGFQLLAEDFPENISFEIYR